MTNNYLDEKLAWRRCELAWSSWLRAERYVVARLGEAEGNGRGTRAPLISIGDRDLRAPDFQTTRAGTTDYWEVKFRTRPDIDPLTGDREHWMEQAAFADYLAIARETGCRVWVVLYEAPTSTSGGRWLRAEARELLARGHRSVRHGDGGDEVAAWLWPVSGMEVINGPEVDLTGAEPAVLPPEGEQTPIPVPDFEDIEREIRKRRPRGDSESGPKSANTDADPKEAILELDPLVGLDVLRLALGISALPRYSVLRVGPSLQELDDLLGLLDYGIRLFVVASPDLKAVLSRDDLAAFVDSRLLEYAFVPDLGAFTDWVVDGQVSSGQRRQLDPVLEAADAAGGINVRQYRVVHAPHDSDVLVTAGAGTGKTETMSERIVFLLATAVTAGTDGPTRPLSLAEVVLVTFTREAAREMRARLARALILRRRLSRRCALPALAWMMQLGSAQISTIHGYAKRLAQQGGGVLGLTPAFTVSRQTMRFRELLHEALAVRLNELFDSYPGNDDVPAAHLWQQHIEQLWQTLENNGIAVFDLNRTTGESALQWGPAPAEGLDHEVASITRAVLKELSISFKRECVESQSVPTSQLVASALSALTAHDDPPVSRPRFVFIDEFQDTDALQMDLMLEIRQRLGAPLFVVGDAKQGIYRFRGAEGNAFQELQRRVNGRGMEPLMTFGLTRNFRSGGLLLQSLHPFFLGWGCDGYLAYGESDRLRPQTGRENTGLPIAFQAVKRRQYSETSAKQVLDWRKAEPKSTIAILCRRNTHARKVQQQIRASGGSCELLVGGSFFTSPAVREMRVLLEAVRDPSDDAALLELCETRWAAGVRGDATPRGMSAEASQEWQHRIEGILPWRDRLTHLETTGHFTRQDLEPLRRRVTSLSSMLRRMPTLDWVVECARTFTPESCALPFADDDVERRRYGRCLDHLLTLLDAQFEESPATLDRVLFWLRLQISTNDAEDEPMDIDDLTGSTTALTVHKAKGLEFDSVLIPHTWSEFATPHHVKTVAAVLRETGGSPKLVWKWRRGLSGKQWFRSGPDSDQELWDQDLHETAREEARLLYVAMTRARERLLVYTPAKADNIDPKSPNSWGDLISIRADLS